jgi:hypothetical protein
MKKTLKAIAAILISLLTFQNSFAQKPFLYLYGGTSLTGLTTSAYFESDIPGINTSLNLEDDLSLPDNKALVFIRTIVGTRLQLDFSYLSVKRSGSNLLSRQFAFGDSVYQVGTDASGYFNTKIYSGTIRLAFINNSKASAGISLGGRYLKMGFGVKALTYGVTYERNETFNLPLFMPGVHASFSPVSAVMIRGSFEYFRLVYSGAKGKIMEAKVSAEYYFNHFLGAGIGYNIIDYSAENLPDNDIFIRDVNYKLRGVNLYAAFRF